MIRSEPDSEIADICITELPETVNRSLLVTIDDFPEVNVPVSSLISGFRLRQGGTDAGHVRLLADAAESMDLPPILVQRRGLQVIDGIHRLEAAKLRSEATISARIVDCTDEEALILAVRSNTLHGLPLTRADRIASAKRILTAHPDWSDRVVAGIAGLSGKSIASLRNSPAGGMQFDGKRLGRDGKRRPVVPGEGRQRAAEYIRAHPNASVREVSRETDVSLGTAHDVRDRLRREPSRPLRVMADPAGQTTGPEPSGPAQPPRPATGPDGDAGREEEAQRPLAAVPEQAQSRQEMVRPVNRGFTARGTNALAWAAVSGKLAADPALRYTDGGRAFLRWMATHSMRADEWREFIDAVPQYWLEDVSRIAAGMSDEWRQFADRLSAMARAAD
jgi:hypothetical protein